jgi:hypothetical protein
MHEEAQRSKRLTLHLKRELQEVERKKEAMERERLSYINEAREKANEAMKARLESAQIVAQSRGDAESKVSELNKYVQEQERLRIAAEDRAREEKKKAGWLADRNKLLSGKLDAKRKELAALQQTIRQSSAGYNDQAKAKGKARALEQQADDDHDDNISAKREPDEEDADVGLEWPINGASDDRYTFSSQPAPKESRSDHDTVVILDDDLDDDFDDSSYMMPTFNRTSKPTTGYPSSYIKPSSNIVLPGDRRASRTMEDEDLDNSVEFVSVKRPRHHRTADATSANLSPRRSSRSHGSSAAGTSGVANMLPGNDTLYSRITSGSMLFGPRRRAK